MAKYWDIVDSYTTTKVISQTQSVKVEAVALYTKPSRVYMRVIVPFTAYQEGKTASYLEPPVLLTEQLMGNDLGVPGEVVPYVTAARQVQDTDKARLLADFMVFTVSYTPDNQFALPLTEDVTIPMTSLETFAAYSEPIDGGQTAQQLILAAHARLVKLAGS